MNRFGDLFLAYKDGSVHMLDVGSGTVKRIADSRDDFRAMIESARKRESVAHDTTRG
jgi:hypothetical protein